MFELHKSSPDQVELAEKIDKIISNIEGNQAGNHENQENVISDDDATIVLCPTDEDDKSISEEDSSKKKRSISVTSDQSQRSSHTSLSSNKRKNKSKIRRGFHLKKKLSEESENVLQVKLVEVEIGENPNGSPGKTKTPSKQEVEKVKLPDPEGKVVRRGRKVIGSNNNSITTRSPPKPPQSAFLTLDKTVLASSLSSSVVEKPGEESAVKTRGLVEDENQNGSPGKTKTPSKQEVEKVKLPDPEGKVVRRGRKRIGANNNSITTRSPPKPPQSASLSLPDVYKTVASSLSSPVVEKPCEESTVKTRGRRAAATPHSTPKNNKRQSESDEEKEEELKGPAKFKKFKSMTDRMGSAVVLLQRLNPLIIFQTRVANKKSSSEEKGAIEKSAVPDETGTPKPAEEEIPRAELIISLGEHDASKSKTLPPRKREIESVSGGTEEKRPRVEENATLIVIAIPQTSVAIEENSPTEVDNLKITEEKLVDARGKVGRRRGRPRKSITPVPTNQIASSDDSVICDEDLFFARKSEKNHPVKSKSKLHSENSEGMDDVFVEEAVSERQPPAKEDEASTQDTQSVDQEESLIEDTPSKLTSKRGRGRPKSKAASGSVLANILTRRNSNTSSVTPPKKIRLSDEISITSVVESRDVENSEKGNVTNGIQKKGVKSGARRGRPAKASISPKTTIEKSPVVKAATTRLTRKTTTLTSLERRIKSCHVLLERDPEIEALCIAMIISKGKRKKVAAATSQVKIPVAARVTRGRQKPASECEQDSKISPLSLRRKRII